jgi:hypothetical protein
VQTVRCSLARGREMRQRAARSTAVMGPEARTASSTLPAISASVCPAVAHHKHHHDDNRESRVRPGSWGTEPGRGAEGACCTGLDDHHAGIELAQAQREAQRLQKHARPVQILRRYQLCAPHPSHERAM